MVKKRNVPNTIGTRLKLFLFAYLARKYTLKSKASPKNTPPPRARGGGQIQSFPVRIGAAGADEPDWVAPNQ